MGPINVQPYVVACQRLYTFVAPSRETAEPRRTLAAADNFLVAAAAFEISVSSEHVPNFPDEKRQDIRRLIESIRDFNPVGQISDFVIAAAVQELQRKGLMPDAGVLDQKDLKKREQGIAEFLAAAVTGAVMGALWVHPEERQSLRGLGDRRVPAETRIVEEVSQEDILEEIPLVYPRGNILLIRGGRYVAEDGKIERSINPAPYRLTFPAIARGGNSHVFLAQEISLKELGLNEEIGARRQVAVKIVTFADRAQRDNVLRQFQKEIEYQTLFQSDRLVRVYSAGLTAQGNPFLVMEYCEGGTLGALMQRMESEKTAFDLNRTLKIAREIVAAVAEAHDAGIVHRDIKPHNFFVTAKGSIKLGDCGLAEREELLPKHATPNDIVGTPGYIPPESARHGWAGGKRGDVFALGVTLYELFTGIFCFQADNAVEMMQATCDRDLVSPATRRPDRKIPRVVDRLLMKCLEKDANKRYPDARELLYDLLTAQASELIERAEEARRQTKDSNLKIVTDDAMWTNFIQEALRKLREVYDQFAHPKILVQRLRLNFELYRWAKKKGDEELLRRTADSLGGLAPALEGENRKDMERRLGAAEKTALENDVNEVARRLTEIMDKVGPDTDLLEEAREAREKFLSGVPSSVRESLSHRLEGFCALALARRRLRVRLRPDDPALALRARIEIVRESYTAGFVEFEKRFSRQEGFSKPEFSLERGFYSLRVTAPNCVPLAFPLPVRPGRYDLRIPFYTRRDVPDPRAVVIPASPVAAFTAEGSFSQLLEENAWRFLSHDVAVLPLRTNQDWRDYLSELVKTIGAEEAAKRLPSNWRSDGKKITYPDGDEIWDAPVTHLPAGYVEEYLTHLSQKLGILPQYRLRLPRLDEWKAALRGPRPQRWPWGDSPPIRGTVCFRFMNHDNSGERGVNPSPDMKFMDISPYSAPEVGRVLAHVASNVQKPLDVSDPNDRKRIAAAFNVDDAEAFFRDNIVVAGTSYRSPATTNPDILDHRGKNEVGDWGILPVIQLKPAEALPSPDSLRQ